MPVNAPTAESRVLSGPEAAEAWRLTSDRAAVATARAHDPGRIRRARLAAGAVLLSGLLTLGLSIAGL